MYCYLEWEGKGSHEWKEGFAFRFRDRSTLYSTRLILYRSNSGPNNEVVALTPLIRRSGALIVYRSEERCPQYDFRYVKAALSEGSGIR
jgi:hypothetical protein